jgi:hypothetical protein
MTNYNHELAAFARGDVEAYWRLVRHPPREWRFTWFPGDVEILGQSLEETIGIEQATLLQSMRALADANDLPQARQTLEEFVRDHPGDMTAISAGFAYTLAEERLTR